jgi:hypothetical protein
MDGGGHVAMKHRVVCLFMMAAYVVLGAPAMLSGCGGGTGFGVATTVLFDGSIGATDLMRVSALQVSVTGDENYSGTEALQNGALRTERFIYRPRPSSRSLLMAVAAVDAQGNVLASGESGFISLSSNGSVPANILLHAGPLPDGGFPNVDGFPNSDAYVPHDLRMVDAAGGQSLCPELGGDTSVLACYGFETASDIQSDPLVVNGTVALDTSRYFRGASSLLLKTTAAAPDASAPEAWAVSSYSVSTTLAELHVRAFIYAHGSLTQSTPLFDFTSYIYQPGVTLGLAANGALSATIDDLEGPNNTLASPIVLTSATKLPTDTWTCLELVLAPSNITGGRIEVFMNEAHLTDLDYNGPTEGMYGIHGPSLLLNFGTAQTFEVWMDEVIFATAQVGCEK